MFKTVIVILKRLGWYGLIAVAGAIGASIALVAIFGSLAGYLLYVLPTAARLSTAFPGGETVALLLIIVTMLAIVTMPAWFPRLLRRALLYAFPKLRD